MMSDPFSTTYQGSQQALGSYGQAFQTIAEKYAKNKELENKQKSSIDFLRKMGIIKEEETQPTFDDYKNEALKQNSNLAFNVSPDMPEEQKISVAQKLFDAVGYPHPQPKKGKTVVDLDQAAKAGLSYSPTTGETIITPKKPEKTLMEQIQEAGVAKEAGLEYGGGKVKTPSGGGVLLGKKEDAEKIGNAIIEGKQPPELTRLYGLSGPVRSYLADKGYDLVKAQKDWLATSTYVKNLNSTQQVRLGQAITSVKLSIDPLRELSEEFKRTNLTPANWAELQVAMKTGDPIATKMVTQINLMRDELAQAFMAGGVPTERSLELVKEILQPVFGDQQMDAALDQLKFNLSVRENAISSMTPRTTGGFVGEYGDTGSQITQATGLTSKSSTPKPGLIEDGYKFLGGDPSNPNNWEKQ